MFGRNLVNSVWSTESRKRLQLTCQVWVLRCWPPSQWWIFEDSCPSFCYSSFKSVIWKVWASSDRERSHRQRLHGGDILTHGKAVLEGWAQQAMAQAVPYSEPLWMLRQLCPAGSEVKARTRCHAQKWNPPSHPTRRKHAALALPVLASQFISWRCEPAPRPLVPHTVRYLPPQSSKASLPLTA